MSDQNGNGRHAAGVGTKWEPRPLVDYRHNCGRLLFRGYLAVGTSLSIRCPKCGRLAVFEVGAVLPAELTRGVDSAA